MISNETKDRIYNAIRIEDVVGDYVPLRRRGANLIGLCPFHDERTPSFNVNPARGIYKCFGCGKAGQAVNFVMEMEQCSYPDALRKLAEKYHIEVVEEQLTEEMQQRHDTRESMFILNDWANKWFQQQLWESEEGRAIGLSYFRQRGLRDETIREYGLGYCPERNNQMTAAAVAAGYKEDFLVNKPDPARQDPIWNIGTGLSCKSERDGRLFDRYSARVMFPFMNQTGKVVGFAGRIMTDRKDVGKYVNSPESVIYRKGNELFGIFQAKSAIAKKDMAYLVEGQMDVISMHQAGIANVVCSGGTALTEKHVSALHRFSPNVTILYDGDSAGIHAALRAIPMFLHEGMSVKVMLFPDGDDPDSFARKHSAEEFVAYIQQHAVDFVLFQKNVLLDPAILDIEARRKGVNEIIATIATIDEAVSRQLYTQELANLLGMSVDTVTTSVAQARKAYALQLQQETIRREQIEQRRAEATAAATGAADASQPKVEQSRIQQHLALHYENIIRLLIRHGNELFQYNPDGTYTPIGYYMISDLMHDNMLPENPIYRKVMDEYMAHFTDPGWQSDTFFLQHQDPDICKLAAEMISDRYAMARPVQERDDYDKQATRLLIELKLTLCKDVLEGVRQRTIDAAGDPTLLAQIQSEQQLYIQNRNTLNEALRRL